MLTLLKKIFTWWNRYTLGTRIKTILYGKYVGKDNFGNKYYQDKDGKRWVIYSDEIDASKIPVQWFSWMHSMSNKIENNHNIKKYNISRKEGKPSPTTPGAVVEETAAPDLEFPSADSLPEYPGANLEYVNPLTDPAADKYEIIKNIIFQMEIHFFT